MAANESRRKTAKSRSRTSGGGTARKSSSIRQGGAGEARRAAKGASAKRQGTGGGRGSAAKKSSAAAGARSARGTQSGSRSAAAEATRATKGRASGTPRAGATRKSAGARSDSGSRSRKSAAATARGNGRVDALTLLKADHERVDQMFKRYDRMKEGDERKQDLVQQILEEVRVHAQVEEEIFYPALRARFEEGGKEKETDLLDEADVEHETVKWLMEQLDGEQSDEATRDARVKVMGEYIRHHVEEEEGQIFKAARKVGVDFEELGRRMDARKRQLKGEEPADQEAMTAEGEGGMQVSEPEQMATSGTTH
jgi:hypothetical protein